MTSTVTVSYIAFNPTYLKASSTDLLWHLTLKVFAMARLDPAVTYDLKIKQSETTDEWANYD